jgi:hypothetical protein
METTSHNGGLPQAKYMEDKDITAAFARFCQRLQPVHQYTDKPDYDRRNFQTQRIRSDSNTWARCGAKSNGKHLFGYNADQITDHSTGWLLGLFTHEAVHLRIGTVYGEAGHPSEFYDLYEDYVRAVMSSFIDYANIFDGNVDRMEFREFLIDDPVAGTVDRRSMTIFEAQSRLADVAGLDLSDHYSPFGKSRFYTSRNPVDLMFNVINNAAQSQITWEFVPMSQEDIAAWTRKRNDVVQSGTRDGDWYCKPPRARQVNHPGRTMYRVDPNLAAQPEYDHVRASIAYHLVENGDAESIDLITDTGL